MTLSIRYTATQVEKYFRVAEDALKNNNYIEVLRALSGLSLHVNSESIKPLDRALILMDASALEQKAREIGVITELEYGQKKLSEGDYEGAIESIRWIKNQGRKDTIQSVQDEFDALKHNSNKAAVDEELDYAEQKIKESQDFGNEYKLEHAVTSLSLAIGHAKDAGMKFPDDLTQKISKLWDYDLTQLDKRRYVVAAHRGLRELLKAYN